MDDLILGLNTSVKVDNTSYYVVGSITYRNQGDGCTWTEYMLRSISDSNVRWLSIDNTYEEYAIYEQMRYSRIFEEDEMSRNGYRDADSGSASVIATTGNMDVDSGETVQFTEYDATDGENILSIEQWADGIEYSRGYYLNRNEIVVTSHSQPNTTTFHATSSQKKKINVTNLLFSCIAIIILIAALVSVLSKDDNSMENYIANSPNFTYETSITSNLNDKEKANVYTTYLTIDAATKAIIDAIEGDTEDVQQDTEDSTVAILTEDEYCLIYLDESGNTLVQISSRLYTYSSTNQPYRSTSRVRSYYRRYYFSRAFTSDSTNYSSATNGFADYHDGTIPKNTTDTYRNYSNSVRQSSTSSRTSSGGGSGFGK